MRERWPLGAIRTVDTHPLRWVTRPTVAVSIGVLVANDQYLKPHHPGVVSGKVSDFAWTFLVPVFVLVGLETLTRTPASPRTSLMVFGSVGLFFTCLKTLPLFNAWVGTVSTSIFNALPRTLSRLSLAETQSPNRISTLLDHTDLVALVGLWASSRLGRRYTVRQSATTRSETNDAGTAYESTATRHRQD